MFDHIPLVLAQDSDAAPSKPPNPPGGGGSPDAPGNGQQTTEGQAADGTGGPPVEKQRSPFGDMLLPMMLILVVFMFIMFGGQRRERKKHAKMLAAIGKGDRVVTAGGIMGTIVELRDHEVVVKVDENANTRIKFTREAIKSILQEKAE